MLAQARPAFPDSVHLLTRAAERLPRTYIFCTQSGFGSEAARTQAEGWDYHELKSDHDPMVTMPHELARILLEVAARPG